MTHWYVPVLALLAAAPVGCATADTAQSAADTTTAAPRHLRPRQHPATASVNGPATDAMVSPGPASPPPGDSPAVSFGSPVVSNTRAAVLTPRWIPDGAHGRVACDGPSSPEVFSPQSPPAPTTAAIVRSFLPVDRAIRACAPPATARGRFPIHASFTGAGAPQEFAFPGVSLTAAQAACVGEALCAVRLPTFRQVTASVDYEFLVASPDADPSP